MFDEQKAYGDKYMKSDLKHKLYMGFCGFMMRIPPLLSDKGARKGEKGAKANADSLSKEERRVHHFIVKKNGGCKRPYYSRVDRQRIGDAN